MPVSLDSTIILAEISEHGRSSVVLRQLRQLPIAEVCRQRPAAALQDHGPVQPEEDLHRLHLQGLLRQHQKSPLLRFLYAG